MVETLVRLGLEMAIISPGSRSTPLTVALAAHPQVNALPVLDERSAGFFALGAAKRTGRPIVLVCTSGTAAANYYPAVIEAYESRVPLLALSADRPPELRNCASGQTIDQQKLFGDFVIAYAELAIPVADMAMLRYLRQSLAHFWRQAHTGPVHLNCPFRDPLAPLADDSASHLRHTLNSTFFDTLFPPLTHLTPTIHYPLATTPPPLPITPFPLPFSPRGLIIVGPNQPQDPEAFCQAIAHLSSAFSWPVLAEGLSPLRGWADQIPYLITTYDAILRQPQQAKTLVPELVLQVGPLPTSKVLRHWLEYHDPLRWLVDQGPGQRNLDALHGRSQILTWSLETLAATCRERDFLESIAENKHESGKTRSSHSPLTSQILEDIEDGWSPAKMSGSERQDHSRGRPLGWAYCKIWVELEQQTRDRLDTALAQIETLFEGKIPWMLARCLPPETPVMVANSTPVRDVEWFWPKGDRRRLIFFNRGANGIDGTLSTALGIAYKNRPTVLLTGDLALLHDASGFLSAARLQGHLTIVMINNQGGGLFEMLPISQFNPPFEDFFVMPQTVDHSLLCAAYGVAYEQITYWTQLAERLEKLPQSGMRVLEVRCDPKESHRIRETLLNSLPG